MGATESKDMSKASEGDNAIDAVNALDEYAFVEITVDGSLQVENFKEDTMSIHENLTALGATKVESVFQPGVNLLRPTPRKSQRRGNGLAENGFITAVRTAYDSHVPLMISPDHIWTLIAQGLSKHIEQNAEKFRGLFVKFDGKQIIRIRRDQFVKGKQENDWAGCFEEFSQEIEKFVGEDMKSKLCPNFSTTDSIAKACHELGLMDCLKSYFNYRVMTRCGISKVKLQGSEEDWKKLEASLSILDELELKHWREALAPILDNFSRAATGKATDKHFWSTIYKAHLGGGSGAHPTVDGWSTNFFLYVNDNMREDFRTLDQLYKEAEDNTKSRRRWHNPGYPQKAVPVGLSKTPFIWEYLGREIPMYFYGGFVGAKFEDGYVSPVLGWAVGEQERQKTE